MIIIRKLHTRFFKLFLTAIFLFAIPTIAFGQVIINEIAWMGTDISSTDEWIELYNTGTTPVSLDSWKLSADDGTPDINLTGTISGQSYFILERTDDSTLPGITADVIYTGALSNSGEVLTLSDTNGTTIDRVDGASGWLAGDSANRLTMQFYNGGWLTGTSTPKAINITSSADNSAGNNDNTDNDTDTEPSVHVSPLPPTQIDDIQQIRISAGVDRIIPVGTPIAFHAIAIDKSNNPISLSSALWTFGDGGTIRGINAEHIYRYPGVYLVSLNVENNGINAVSYAKIKVFSPDISISEISEEDDKSFIALTNSSVYDMNITDWILKSFNRKFIFPKDTIILSGETIKFPKQITKLKIRDEITLMDAQKSIVDSIRKEALLNGSAQENIIESVADEQSIRDQISEAQKELAILKERMVEDNVVE